MEALPAMVGRTHDEGRGFLARLLAIYFGYRPLIVLFMGLYLLAIHLAVLGLFWRSEWPGVFAWKLGLGTRWVELNPFFGSHIAILRNRAAAVAPGATLYIGDSQLAALDTSALTDHAVQLSIVGDTTRRVRLRIRHYDRAMSQARMVFLHVGTNDLRWRRPDEMARPLDKALALVPKHVPVILSDILPVDERVFRDYGNAQIAEANRVLGRVCGEHPNCKFIESGSVLRDVTGNLDPRLHRGDGLHLNVQGNDVWRRVLTPLVAEWRSFPVAPDAGDYGALRPARAADHR